MGERKVLNKYIPSDFDPSLVPRGKKLSAKDGTVPVRMMLPFSVQCDTCRAFLYRGTKFNSKKEPMGGSNGTYLGITRWRFYIKCTSCARPLTFLTDPQNADYEMESGGTRNYEVLKDNQKVQDAAELQEQVEEELDPMKALENRVLASQQELADLQNLEQIKAMNARHVALLRQQNATSTDGGGNDLVDDNDDKPSAGTAAPNIELTEEDEALVRSIQFGRKKKKNGSIARLDEHDEQRLELERKRRLEELEQQPQQRQHPLRGTKDPTGGGAGLPVITVVRRKRRKPSPDPAPTVLPVSQHHVEEPSATTQSSQPQGGLASLLGAYESDSD